ncbi:MAG: ATP-binding cassette domain-containing protein [Cyclobacteriaceae bacterium]
MIELRNITKKYGTKVALKIEGLTINQGDSVGLVGNNGAGKTTMLSLILDQIKPETGEVYSKSKQVNRTDDWKFYTGSYLDERFLIPHLTPTEYLEFVGSLHDRSKNEVMTYIRENEAFYEEDLFTRKKYIRDLSTGNKNKVGILSALLSSPELLILDEPFASLDPTSQAWLKKRLTEYHESGTTMILSSHDLGHVTSVSSRVILLEDGQVIKDNNTTQETLSELESYFLL